MERLPVRRAPLQEAAESSAAPKAPLEGELSVNAD